MPPFRKPSLVTLRRPDLSQPWGFRLIGGVNHGQPFAVEKVTPESIAFKSGLQEGDELVRIGNITLRGLSHEEVQEIIMRCKNVIDLFVIRDDMENSQNQTKEQQTIVNNQYNSPINYYQTENTGRSLTEQVHVITEGAYYTNSIDYKNPTSPMQQYYVKEQETYQYSDYNSPPLSKSPQSPRQKPPLSGSPFSPPMNRPFSPTNAIIYHQAEEQQWLSTAVPNQQRDNRVFAASPRRSSSPSPVPDYQQKDNRLFGSKPRPSASPSLSPAPDHQRRNEQQSSPNSEEQQRDNRVFGAKPKPIQGIQQSHNRSPKEGPKTTLIKSHSFEDQQQFAPNSGGDNRVFGGNKKPDTFKNPGFERPNSGRVINDRRVFGNYNKPRMQTLGGSFDEQPHWKTPLPQMKSAKADQLLPSQTRQQQTYIVQTPPTERMLRPPLTGNSRRRIRPVWPPPDAHGRFIPKAGFNPDGRDSPNKTYNWPPQFDDEYYYEDTTSPRLKYSNPSPGALQQSWNPRSGSVSPPGVRSSRSRRIKNTAWPPPSNATPAGRVGIRPSASLPGSRRSSQTEEYLAYGINTRIPQTYRPPPGTQYFQQSYYYDTE